MLDLGVDLDAWPWVWLLVSVVFTLVEVTVLGGSFILLPFAVSAFLAAILGFYDVPIEGQWAMFVVGGAAMWVGFYRWAKTFMRSDLPPGVGADRLVGMTGIVTVDIDPDDVDRRGRVSVDGDVWGALVEHHVILAVGTRVRITSQKGTRLVVEPIGPTDDGTGGLIP